MNPQMLLKHFEQGLDYASYLATDPARAAKWTEIYDRAALTPEESQVTDSFTRRMLVMCISGIWCGDCVQQGPLIQRIAEAAPSVDLRWLDRDEHMELTEQVAINAGHRVPVVIFMAEDGEPVSVYGDRTLTRYRAIAAKQLGASCPLPGAPLPDDELRGTLGDWLDEFERVHLLLRLSGRLRQLHGD